MVNNDAARSGYRAANQCRTSPTAADTWQPCSETRRQVGRPGTSQARRARRTQMIAEKRHLGAASEASVAVLPPTALCLSRPSTLSDLRASARHFGDDLRANCGHLQRRSERQPHPGDIPHPGHIRTRHSPALQPGKTGKQILSRLRQAPARRVTPLFQVGVGVGARPSCAR